MDKIELVKKAIEARNNAYAPYSKFKVGAALVTKSGEVYIGANMENASYGLTCCAERNCIFGAYSRGVKKEDIIALAVVGDTERPCSPCGACRQVISEMVPLDCKIYLGNLKLDILETSVKELLPYAFDSSEL